MTFGKQPAPEEGSILSFTPDTRYLTVHFQGTRNGRDTTESMPFLGWAVQVVAQSDDGYQTALVPVGMRGSGEPLTAWDLVRLDELDKASVRVVGVEA